MEATPKQIAWTQGYDVGQDAQPARPVIDADDYDLIIEALGHYAGSLTDHPRGAEAAAATATKASRLQGRLIANRHTLRQVMAGLAPALTMTEH